MPRPSSKKSSKKGAGAPGPNDASIGPLGDQLQPGMPAQDSIYSTTTVKSPKPHGGTFQIIRTFEIDSYEVSEPGAALAVLPLDIAAAAQPAGDNFKGTSRKAAKLSIADAPTEKFKDLKNLIKSLAPEKDMKSHKPPIKTTATSNRVKEEKRNVQVKVFLYAASREDDNDFHLILGRDPKLVPEMYMTMELSGLPPSSNASFAKLKAARDAFKAFFDNNMPGTSYDFYRPPIPVLIEGSLFFDMSHASGSRPGPQSLKSRMPTIWEVHPITKIVFEP